MRVFLLCLISSLLMAACATDEKKNLEERNLLEYGIPFTIYVPDSVKIEKTDYKVQQVVTIQSEKSNDFNVQIGFSEASTTDVGTIKNRELNYVQQMPIFSKVVLDEPNGFIYETVTDSTLHSFGFRRILLQGDREYIFQTGIGTFTKGQAEQMYRATEPKEKRK